MDNCNDHDARKDDRKRGEKGTLVHDAITDPSHAPKQRNDVKTLIKMW